MFNQEYLLKLQKEIEEKKQARNFQILLLISFSVILILFLLVYFFLFGNNIAKTIVGCHIYEKRYYIAEYAILDSENKAIKSWSEIASPIFYVETKNGSIESQSEQSKGYEYLNDQGYYSLKVPKKNLGLRSNENFIKYRRVFESKMNIEFNFGEYSSITKQISYNLCLLKLNKKNAVRVDKEYGMITKIKV